jgi:hypothetical protein
LKDLKLAGAIADETFFALVIPREGVESLQNHSLTVSPLIDPVIPREGVERQKVPSQIVISLFSPKSRDPERGS